MASDRNGKASMAIALLLLLAACESPHYVYQPPDAATIALADCRARAPWGNGSLDGAIMSGASIKNCMLAKGYVQQ